MSAGKGKAGVYFITHKASKRVYVGQAIDVARRWQQHRAALRAGVHHASALQALWSAEGESAFTFEVFSRPEPDLTPLAIQRWLVREERAQYLGLKNQGLELNSAPPSIVSTPQASTEYAAEVKARNKLQDAEISRARKLIREQIAKTELN